VLPDAKDAPTMRTQGPVRNPISNFILSELTLPKISIIRRHTSVLGTAVPKAPVYEDNKSLVSKNEIRFSRQPKIPPPPLNLASTKNLYRSEFCRAIATRANLRHDLTSLFRRIDVSHDAESLRTSTQPLGLRQAYSSRLTGQ
jgi:hypothetical protein